jgi:hypothetical protein
LVATWIRKYTSFPFIVAAKPFMPACLRVSSAGLVLPSKPPSALKPAA